MITLQELQAWNSAMWGDEVGGPTGQEKYAALLAQSGDPACQLILRQYAPQWASHSAPFFGQYWTTALCDTVNNNGVLYLVLDAGGGFLAPFVLSNEDSGDYSWSPGTTLPVGLCRDVSVDVKPGYTLPATYFTIPTGGDYIQLDGGSTFTAPGLVKHMFVGGVGGNTSAHFIGLTSHNNWRLCYRDGSGGSIYQSDIYWPYQVRSFDAIRMGSYDIIAMVTDLPPIQDYTVSGTKTIPVWQRVQGIVLWKFDHTLKTWSDHWTVAVVDNVAGIALANVKMTTYGSEAYMTWEQTIEGKNGLCISKSLDGVNWENPIFYTETTDVFGVGINRSACLIRNGKYMYIASSDICRRAVATNFMGLAHSSLTQDVTAYILTASCEVSNQRAMNVQLSNPNAVLTASTALLGKNIALMAEYAFGYWCDVLHAGVTHRRKLLAPVTSGHVVSISPSQTLPTQHVTIHVADNLALPQMVGSSTAQEWPGMKIGGDCFAGIAGVAENDYSGLVNTVPKEGTWAGGDNGLTYKCVGSTEPGIALTTHLSRAFCGEMSADLSIFKTRGAADPTLDPSGSTWAGLTFRFLDANNAWGARWRPYYSGGWRFEFKLFKWYATNTGGTPVRNEYVAATSDRALDTGFGENRFVCGNLYVRWRYNWMEVYHEKHNQSSPATRYAHNLILSYEAYGMGDNGFGTDAVLENGWNGKPFTAGSAGYLTFSDQDSYKNVSPNGNIESGLTNWIPINNDAGNLHQYAGGRPGSSGSWLISTDTIIQNGKGKANSGCALQAVGYTSTGLNLRARIWANVTTEHEGVEVWLRAVHTKDGSSKTLYTGGNRVEGSDGWKEIVMDWPEDDERKGSTLSGLRLEVKCWYPTSDPFSFECDDAVIEQEQIDPRIYFNSAATSDAMQLYSMHDALAALLAYSGVHLTTRSYAMNELFDSLAAWNTDWGNPQIVGGRLYMNGASQVSSLAVFTTPAIVEFDRVSGAVTLKFAYGSTYLSVDISNTGLTLYYSGATGRNTFAVTKTISAGRTRLVVTSNRLEGTTLSRTTTDVDDYLLVAVYVNGALVATSSFALDSSITDWDSPITIAGNGCTLDNLTVEEIGKLVQFFSVDPGETASSGIARVVGQSRIQMLCRHTGNVRISRPVLSKSQADWIVPADLMLQREDSIKPVPVGHYRIVGAWTEMNVWDRDGMNAAWRHVFAKRDDPNLLTGAEMTLETDYLLDELAGQRDRVAVNLPPKPLLEPYDWVVLRGATYIIESYQSTVQSSGNTLTVTGSVTLRKAMNQL